MGKCRLYIADMDERFVAKVRRVISETPNIEIVGNANNGKTALNEIMRMTPDVVLTDIPLPEMDGITLLCETRRFRRAPSVIVCTRFYSEASMQCACRYGAAFFLCKPIEMQTLPQLISECGRTLPQENSPSWPTDIETDASRRCACAVRAILKEIGMSARLDGSAYFLEAAIRCHDNELLLRNLSRGLYAHLAQCMDTTASRVERSMRSAIAIAYERGNLSRYFAHKPTNREFIAFLMRAVDQAEATKS